MTDTGDGCNIQMVRTPEDILNSGGVLKDLIYTQGVWYSQPIALFLPQRGTPSRLCSS